MKTSTKMTDDVNFCLLRLSALFIYLLSLEKGCVNRTEHGLF